MAKAKAKKRSRKNPSSKRAAKSAASVARVKAPGLFVGAAVRVRHGVWGNATGRVAGLSSSGVLVRLDAARVMDPIPFDSANLVVGGPLDRF